MSINYKVGVVYLCRAAEEKTLFLNFIHSYKKFSANCNHELIIIFKGFQDFPQSYLEEIQAIFEPLDYLAIYLSEEGFDVGSYLVTARLVNHNYLFFLNTHTTIVSDVWLSSVYNAINFNNVGLIGTTASYESISSTVSLASRFSDLYFKKEFQKKLYILDYYRWLVIAIDPNNDHFKQLRRYIKFKIKNAFNSVFRKKFSNTSENNDLKYLREIYPPFPNPHIRSNGFMISRELLLNLFGEYEVKTKEDACKFESGKESLTRKIWDLGMKTLLVGKNGIAYDVKDWRKSNTFRLGTQSNLLTNDNQTRNYDNFSEQEKMVHAWISWGDDIIRSQPRFPHLGFSFDAKPLKDNFFS